MFDLNERRQAIFNQQCLVIENLGCSNLEAENYLLAQSALPYRTFGSASHPLSTKQRLKQ